MIGLNDAYGGPLRRDYIRRQALTLRYILGVEREPAPDVARILEHVLPELAPSFEFRVVPNGDIGGDGALTSWDPPCISFEERAYHELALAIPRARFTGLHELGHLTLHRGMVQARNTAQVRDVRDLNSVERHANCFAAEFAMPHDIIKDCKVPRDVATLCKVSVEAAEYRMRDCAMWPRGDDRQRIVDGFADLLKKLRSKN